MQGLIQVFLMIRFVGFGSCSWSELWRLLGKLLNTFFFRIGNSLSHLMCQAVPWHIITPVVR